MGFLNETATTEVSVGEYDLYDSGYVISPKGDDIRIKIDDLVVEFEFLYDGSGESEILTDVKSDKSLRLTLKNHGGGVRMGGITPQVGSTNPLSIGMLHDRELFLMYRMKTEYVNEKPSTVTLYYNFYLGGEIDDPDLKEEEGE